MVSPNNPEMKVRKPIREHRFIYVIASPEQWLKRLNVLPQHTPLTEQLNEKSSEQVACTISIQAMVRIAYAFGETIHDCIHNMLDRLCKEQDISHYALVLCGPVVAADAVAVIANDCCYQFIISKVAVPSDFRLPKPKTIHKAATKVAPQPKPQPSQQSQPQPQQPKQPPTLPKIPHSLHTIEQDINRVADFVEVYLLKQAKQLKKS